MNNSKYSITICPKCSKIPSVTVAKDQEYQVRVKCVCSYDEFLSFEKYFQMNQEKEKENKFCGKKDIHKELQVEGVEYCFDCSSWLCDTCLAQHNTWIKNHSLTDNPLKPPTNCNKHKDKIIDYYCHDCKDHYCSDCTAFHYKHNTVNIENLVTSQRVKGITEEFNNAKKESADYIKGLVTKYTNKLYAEIHRVEEAERKNNKINENVCKLIETFLDNYSASNRNFFIIINLLNIAHFEKSELNISEDITKDNIDKIVYYLENTVLCKKKKALQESLSLKATYVSESLKTVNQIIGLIDGRLAIAGSNLSVYEFKTMEPDYIISNEQVNTISQLQNANLLAGIFRKVYLYELYNDSYKNIGIYDMHRGEVFHILAFSDLRVASCSADNSIRLWSAIPPFKQIRKMKGHTRDVTTILQLEEKNMIVSGSLDSTIKFWDITPSFFKYGSYYFVTSLPNIRIQQNSSMLEIPHDRILVGIQKEIVVIDIKKYQEIKRVKDNDFNTISSFLLLRDGSIFCSDKENIYLVESYNCGIVFKKKNILKNNVTSMIFATSKLILSGDLSGELKVWDFEYI